MNKTGEILKSYDRQIEYQVQKENQFEKTMKNLEQSSHKLELETIKNPNKVREDIIEKKAEIKQKQKNELMVGKIIEEVNSGLHKNKHVTLKEQVNLSVKTRKINEKIMKFKNYIDIFSQVKSEAKSIISKKLEKETIKDMRNLIERLGEDQPNLLNNLFNTYEVTNPDSDSLLESVYKAGENLEELEDKITSYVLDENNLLGKKAIACFKSNILLAKKVK